MDGSTTGLRRRARATVCSTTYRSRSSTSPRARDVGAVHREERRRTRRGRAVSSLRVKSRVRRFVSEIRLSRWASMFTSPAMDEDMTSRFLRATDLAERARGPAGDARPHPVEAPLRRGVDEEPVHEGQELVPGGAVHVPALRHAARGRRGSSRPRRSSGRARQPARLEPVEDPLEQGRRGGPRRGRRAAPARGEARAAPRGGRPGGAGSRRRARRGRRGDRCGARSAEPVADQPEDEPVRLVEHARILHPDRREPVHVEEAPVVDLLPGDAPEREAVGLRVEEPLEEVEASAGRRRAR